MSEKIFIGVAWPYANGSLHLGHIAGCYLPADIFARYNRMKGNDVLMVSGSDEHGTPITVTAEKENTTPQAIVDRYNREHTENMKQLGISFDLFTRTTTENHEKVVQDIFLTLYKKGFIYKKELESYYCPNCKRFLPDRYIEGICPFCGNENARGDQCDECGKLLDPQQLLNVKCKICGITPILKNTEHLFFALSKFEEPLLEWLKEKNYWKPSVLKFTQNWLKDGLHDRAITRDINWGVPIPLDGFEDKRIYVWFDAVIGYLSASKEWAQKINEPDKWKEWWLNAEAKHYYFLAKDNIPFHSIIWPSILMGYDERLSLPYDIPANEYLRLGGEQFSKSKGLGIWVPEVIKKFNVESIRYYLSINMPEQKDTNWMWDEFVARNNDELVGTYGNLIHRVMTFTYNNFNEIPPLGELKKEDEDIIEKIENIHREVGENLEKCEFKKGLKKAMSLAHLGNVYFNNMQPWHLIKTDKNRCATVLHVCLKIVQALAISMAPYLPFSSDKIWHMLGNSDSIHNAKWEDALKPLNVGYKLGKPKPLFDKIAIEEVSGEMDTFSMLDLRSAKILSAENHPNADRLYVLEIDVGALGKRTLVAGLKNYYSIDELIGKNIVIVANLKPAKLRGVESKGMLLAAEDKEGNVVLLTPGDVKPGESITIEGIPSQPAKVLEFSDFQKISMTVDENQNIIYQGKPLRSSKGFVKTEKPISEGAEVH